MCVWNSGIHFLRMKHASNSGLCYIFFQVLTQNIPRTAGYTWLHYIYIYMFLHQWHTGFSTPIAFSTTMATTVFFSSQRNLHLRRGRTWTSARNPTGMTKPCLWQRTRLRIGTRKAPPCASRKRPGDKATFGGNGVATVNFEWENLGLLCDVVCVFFFQALRFWLWEPVGLGRHSVAWCCQEGSMFLSYGDGS